MQEIRKAPPCGNTDSAQDARQTLTKACNDIVTQDQSAKKEKMLPEHLLRLYSLIPYGSENAISMKYLAEWYCTDERAVRKAVFEARCKGLIIAGTAAGYYRPKNLAELKCYYAQARSRGRATFESIKAVRKEIERLERAGHDKFTGHCGKV